MEPRAAPSVQTRTVGPYLSTKHLRLWRARGADDLAFLYALAVNEETGFRWRYRGVVPSYDEFAREVGAGVLAEFVVGRENGERVGQAVLYGYDDRARYAYIGLTLAPRVWRTGVAMEAFGRLVTYAFECYPLRKLYLEVPAFNLQEMKSAIGEFFVEEGCLRGHVYAKGQRFDMHILSLSRDDARRGFERYAEHLGVRSSGF